MMLSNSSEVALDALPLLYHPLANLEHFTLIRCPILEPLMIVPPTGDANLNPEDDLFEHPIQIVPVALGYNHVTLAVYAHKSLQYVQGPDPDTKWLQDCIETITPSSGPSATRNKLVNLCDELRDLVETHQFFYDSIDELIHSGALNDSSASSAGIRRFSHWLHEQENGMVQRIQELCMKI